MSAERDSVREQAWLEAAEQDAGASGFACHVVERLLAGESVYGDRWATVGLRKLIAELMEEAADLGAWAVLALQVLGEQAERDLVASALRAAILWGAYAHHALALGLDHLEAPQPGAATTGRPNAET